jgi:hypothetical protein
MSFLSNKDLQRARNSWNVIHDRGGNTYVDETFVDANGVAAFFNTAADDQKIGIIKAQAMIASYESHAKIAKEVNIHIETEPQGTIEYR